MVMSPDVPQLGDLESIEHTRWRAFPVFRETWLAAQIHPLMARCLRILGQTLFQATQHPEFERVQRPDVRLALCGAARDLRYLQGALDALGQAVTSPSPEVRQVVLAEEVSMEVGRLAEKLEGALKAGI